jgi:hypothetical protein
MPAKKRPSDDPAERQRQFILAREAYETALDQNSVDIHDGRIATYGVGAIEVLAKRVDAARAAVEEMKIRG